MPRQKSFMAKKLKLLRVSIGILFLWFGILKFFKGLSPAETIAVDTIDFITFNLIPHSISIILLAVIEVIIGFLLVANIFLKQTIIVTMLHLACTFIPLFVFSSLSFTAPPYAFSLLGQYIVKNIALLAALWVLYPSKKH